MGVSGVARVAVSASRLSGSGSLGRIGSAPSAFSSYHLSGVNFFAEKRGALPLN